MAINLTATTAIQSGLFVRINCPYYKATPAATPTTEILRFSDYKGNVTINSEVYQGVGRLLSITNTTSEINLSKNDVTITLSGIPDTSIAEIINSRIKGSEVKIYRALFNPTTGNLLSISGNPLLKFQGIITNYSLNEEFDDLERRSSNSIVLVCASAVSVLSNTTKGRRTNPEDQKRFFSSDLSMDRVPSLIGSNFDFGAPK